jgi:hypothetical protein
MRASGICVEILVKVSRSFAVVIQELHPELRDAVCSYITIPIQVHLLLPHPSGFRVLQRSLHLEGLQCVLLDLALTHRSITIPGMHLLPSSSGA